MNGWLPLCAAWRLATGLGVCLLAFAPARAEPAPAPPGPPLAVAPAAPPALPPAPKFKPPVDQFRELLAARPAGREKLLAERAPESRKSLEAKLREYEALPPEERELRLRATELRWHLLSLMRTPPDRRADLLATVPETLRKLIEPRLGWWDQLSAAEQAEFLENQAAVQFIARLETCSPAEQVALRQSLPSERLRKLEADLARVQALPPSQRQRFGERINRFFELAPREKEKTLGSLSGPERAEMQQALDAFARLPQLQRAQCISAFTRFAGMTAVERQQFFRNVERWQAMTPAEREDWRRLVRQITQWPPLPPGLDLPPAPPPLPGLSSVPGR